MRKSIRRFKFRTCKTHGPWSRIQIRRSRCMARSPHQDLFAINFDARVFRKTKFPKNMKCFSSILRRVRNFNFINSASFSRFGWVSGIYRIWETRFSVIFLSVFWDICRNTWSTSSLRFENYKCVLKSTDWSAPDGFNISSIVNDVFKDENRGMLSIRYQLFFRCVH